MPDHSGSADPGPSRGAYGLAVDGLADTGRWLQPVDPDSPRLDVQVRPGPADPRPHRLDRHIADLPLLGGGRMVLRRGEGVVRYCMPVPLTDAELVHPFLAPAAAAFWTWEGALALHAAALLTPAGALLVFGAKGSGKSTTLAALAAQGTPVVADDLAVVRDGLVAAGPRGIDLRTGAAGLGEWRGQVVRPSGGGRLRLSLPPVAAHSPVAGIVLLAWGDEVRLRPVAPGARIGVLAAQRSFPGLGADPVALLELAALPTAELVRPPGRVGLDRAVQALLERWA